MKEYDIIIIGGGASGLYCASHLSKKYSIAILDSAYSLGKKILVTGNGRCNLTNVNMDSSYYNVNIDKFLKSHSEKDAIKYFNSLGLDIIVDNEGRVYPFTNYAKSVVDILNKTILKNKNIDIITNCKVKDIEFCDNNYIVVDNNTKYFSKIVVICTGNIDNEIIKNSSINSVEKFPSLVALKTSESTKNLDGIRVNNIKLTAKIGNQVKTQKGELLFKDNGLSGISIFNLSTLFARNKKYDGIINIDLMPDISENKTIEILKNRCKIFNKVVDMFDGLFMPPLREELCKRCKIDEQISTSKLTLTQLKTISKIIHNLQYNINGHYDNYQVVSGGISLDELTDNLESKKYKGVYFAGEVIDVDGECGGYNLQWAWTSGAIVAKHLNNMK